MGSWNVLDAIAIADCALEIHGRGLDDLFAIGEPGGTYDPGMATPPDGDPWDTLAALD